MRRRGITARAVATPFAPSSSIITQTEKARNLIPAATNATPAKAELAKGVLTVDLSAFYDGTNDASRKMAAAEAIRTSWVNTGTFFVAVQDQDKPVLRAAVTAAKSFFTRPREEKDAVNRLPNGSTLKKIETVVRGYVGPGSESAAALGGRPRATADKAEKYTWRADNVSYQQVMHAFEHTFADIDAFELERAVMRPNRFPTDAAGEEMQKALLAYSDVVSKLTDATLRACAMAMGQDEEEILRRFCPGANGTAPLNCRALSYPPAPQESTGEHRTGAHTDGGVVTLVYRPYDTAEHGLQIIQDGVWKNVPPSSEDKLVVHPGDVLEWYSDGLFPALWHRVPPPPPGAPARMSFPSFVLPTIDFSLSDLGSGRNYKLGDLRFSGWVKAKFEALANGRRADADADFDESALLPAAEGNDDDPTQIHFL